MNSKEVNEILERVNTEYNSVVNSKEYNLGRRIYKYLNYLKTFNIKAMIGGVKQSKSAKLATKHVTVKKPEHFFNKGEVCEDGIKGVVYTCITGGYDCVKEPLFAGHNLDYVLFCDDTKKEGLRFWEAREIPAFEEVGGKNLKNRYCKMHPFDLFPSYDYAIYIDGNVNVVADISVLYDVARKSKIGIAMHQHPDRDCVYDEAKTCVALGKGDKDKIEIQMKEYESLGFPHNFGLCEATIIVFDLHNPVAKEIMDSWWSDFNIRESGRDQLSFPFVIWKNGYSIDDVGCLGDNKKYNLMFRVSGHE